MLTIRNASSLELGTLDPSEVLAILPGRPIQERRHDILDQRATTVVLTTGHHRHLVGPLAAIRRELEAAGWRGRELEVDARQVGGNAHVPPSGVARAVFNVYAEPQRTEQVAGRDVCEFTLGHGRVRVYQPVAAGGAT